MNIVSGGIMFMQPNLISAPRRTVITFVFTSEPRYGSGGMWTFFWSVRKLTPRRCVSDLSLLKSEAPRASLSPFTPRENEISPFIY